MSLKLSYYGQNDGTVVPDVALVGDPGVDQAALTAAGFLGGRIVTLEAAPSNVSNTKDGAAAIVCDSASHIPFATLLNGPGEFAGAIGPSGSRKVPVVRALWQGIVDAEAYDTTDTGYAVGAYLYCGASTKKGLYVSAPAGTLAFENVPVGICTHVPTAAEPWLGVSSLL